MLAWHYWLIAAIILCIIEIFTIDFLALGLGIAAVITSIAAAMGASLEVQVGVFAVASIIMIFTVRPLFRKAIYKHSDDRKSNVDALHGQQAVVIEAIPGNHESGRVKLGAEEWRAISLIEDEIPAGATVHIERVDGSTLVVRL